MRITKDILKHILYYTVYYGIFIWVVHIFANVLGFYFSGLFKSGNKQY